MYPKLGGQASPDGMPSNAYLLTDGIYGFGSLGEEASNSLVNACFLFIVVTNTPPDVGVESRQGR